jgi:hypothetical protein
VFKTTSNPPTIEAADQFVVVQFVREQKEQSIESVGFKMCLPLKSSESIEIIVMQSCRFSALRIVAIPPMEVYRVVTSAVTRTL